MSAEALQQPFGGRKEYSQTPAEKLEECEVITDVIDTILHSSLSLSGSVHGLAESSRDGTHLHRSFEYLERDIAVGWAWPLTEKQFDIEYLRDCTSGTCNHEVYKVNVKSVIHQKDTRGVIQSTYFIEYYGADRGSATSTIWQMNLVEPDGSSMATRDTTPYDQMQLFNELAGLQNAIDAGEQEHFVVTALSRTLE